MGGIMRCELCDKLVASKSLTGVCEECTEAVDTTLTENTDDLLVSYSVIPSEVNEYGQVMTNKRYE